MRILDIVEGTTVDGPGFRTSIYVAGCKHACEGCHNPQSWDFSGGHEMSEDEILSIIEKNRFNVTLSGGDPFYQPEAVTHLCSRIKGELGKTIWCYTGFLWEQIYDKAAYRPLLQNIDVLVDGPFILKKRDTTLIFRGSDNQRIIDVPASIGSRTPVVMDYAKPF